MSSDLRTSLEILLRTISNIIFWFCNSSIWMSYYKTVMVSFVPALLCITAYIIIFNFARSNISRPKLTRRDAHLIRHDFHQCFGHLWFILESWRESHSDCCSLLRDWVLSLIFFCTILNFANIYGTNASPTSIRFNTMLHNQTKNEFIFPFLVFEIRIFKIWITHCFTGGRCKFENKYEKLNREKISICHSFVITRYNMNQ